MQDVGESYGCGRAMWEYNKDVLDPYGTPMAPMLLPYWSDGCIDSMEGLYFESSATVPYHFLNQSELSEGPSRPMRANKFGIPNVYSPLDIPRGVEHMQLFGVRYYMTATEPDGSERTKLEARAHPDLTEIASSGPWTIFLVEDSELVVPLEYEPVVWDGIGNSQEDWLPHSATFYNSYDRSVFPAASGPEGWARVPIGEQNLPRKRLPAVQVFDIDTTDDSISFSVDRVGQPVLGESFLLPQLAGFRGRRALAGGSEPHGRHSHFARCDAQLRLDASGCSELSAHWSGRAGDRAAVVEAVCDTLGEKPREGAANPPLSCACFCGSMPACVIESLLL